MRYPRYPPADSVAGVYTPAFVERLSFGRIGGGALGCVAGVYTPAFVERSTLSTLAAGWTSVAGVYTPAFVERLMPAAS